MFMFRGNLLSSKSWANRALVIQHFNPQIEFEINSCSEDIVSLRNAIQAKIHNEVFDLGLGGTSFRFFCFLISRYPGKWVVSAHSRLLERPQEEICEILGQLGVKSKMTSHGLEIHSKGWNQTSKVHCSADRSSQFITGLLLSCWRLKFDLEIEIAKPVSSFGYLKMTLEILHQSGMQVKVTEQEDLILIKVLKEQQAKVRSLKPEPDVSSAFALAAAAVLDGNLEIENWNQCTDQPDWVFLDLFKKMGIAYQINNNSFKITKQDRWKSINFNLADSPDLFPVLSVLCAFGEGVSSLTGGRLLKYKESDRIKKTKELLDLIQVKNELLPDGIRIFGGSGTQPQNVPLQFNPDHDHRMAMAAGLIKLKNYNLEILTPDVVNKSYPNFWKDIGLVK